MNDTFTIIRDNLTRAYIFYVPESLYHELQNSLLKDIIPIDATNTITFMDSDRNISTKITPVNKVQIISKGNILEENIFLLLDAQAKLNLEQFGYLLKKYRNHLDTHTYITNWMANNINKFFKDVSDVFKNMFITQSNTFKEHHDLIITKFGFVESKLRSNRFKEKFASPDFKFTIPNLVKGKVENKTSKPRKNKTVIISDDEADAFLLESVFNVELINDHISIQKSDLTTKK